MGIPVEPDDLDDVGADPRTGYRGRLGKRPICTLYLDLTTGELAKDPDKKYREEFSGSDSFSLRYIRHTDGISVQIGGYNRHLETVDPVRWNEFLDLLQSGKLTTKEKKTVAYGFVREGFGCLAEGEDEGYKGRMSTFLCAVKRGLPGVDWEFEFDEEEAARIAEELRKREERAD